MQQSIWQATADLPVFPSLQNDCKTHVLIIGGGMAGVLTAYFLHQKGVDYILVEQDRIGSGVTGNTTAKITAQHGFVYQKLVSRLGSDIAGNYLNANRKAVSDYARLCKEIDCDFQTKDNIVYSLNDPWKVEKELEALIRIGYPAKRTKGAQLPFKIAGGVTFPAQAQFHPLKFMAGLVKDLHILEQTKVLEMVGNTAVTPKGKIKADKVVVTTHFPFLNKHGSYFLKLYQHRSYVLALENAPQLPGMYVDESKTGFSLRNHGEYLLVGGGAHRTGKQGGNFKVLRAFAKEFYPAAEERFHWATQDCMSLDSIPYIGQYSKSTPNLYTACGFNKWGMTGSMVAARLLSDAIIGRSNEFEELFDPSRSMIKPQLFANGWETTVSLLTPSAKRCPHMGCALQWNRAEHTWDCPCHGSRFAKDGKLLNNPATDDLPKQP